MIGTVIHGKYQVQALLGQGGMGAVYEAIHVGTRRRVAVKVILGAAKNEMVARFQREARAAGAIDTQHIVQVLDSGVDPDTGTPYMVMELLRGRDLQQLVDRTGALPPELALRVAGQACAGLAKAHRAGVTHRDIKPANIHLSEREDGEIVVKLLDFGVAKISLDVAALGAADVALTRTGSMLGSPLYMSPEQAMGLKTMDERSDIWSMGVVMYEMFTGVSPYAELPTLGLLLVALASKDPVPLQKRAPWVSADVAQIVHAALQRDVAARFQSVDALASAIQGLLRGGLSIRGAMFRSLSPEEKAQVAASVPTAPLRLGVLAEPAGVPGGDTGDDSTPGLDGGEEGAASSDERAFAPTAPASEGGVAPDAVRGGLASGPGASVALTGDHGVSRSRAARARRVAPLALGVVAALGAGGFFALRPLATRAPPGAPPAVTAAPASTSAEPSVVPAAPLQADIAGRFAVDPPEATCVIDGVAAVVTGGQVEVRGRPGSIHHVALRLGEAVVEGDLVMTEAGPMPPRMALPASRAPAASSANVSGRPRGTASRPAPRAETTAVPAHPGGDPHMDTSFP